MLVDADYSVEVYTIVVTSSWKRRLMWFRIGHSVVAFNIYLYLDLKLQCSFIYIFYFCPFEPYSQYSLFLTVIFATLSICFAIHPVNFIVLTLYGNSGQLIFVHGFTLIDWQTSECLLNHSPHILMWCWLIFYYLYCFGLILMIFPPSYLSIFY